jgi:hypothetical protein
VSEFQFIPLHELTPEDKTELFGEYAKIFTNRTEFDSFYNMQSNFYVKGIRRQDFEDNAKRFAISMVVQGLQSKLGNDLGMKIHQTQDGDEFYSLGDTDFNTGRTSFESSGGYGSELSS